MKILAVDFSSSLRSVALAEGAGPSFRLLATAAEHHGPETHAFAMIEQLLAESGARREEIECLALGLGPGSYAGIRISLAIAQGWQLARGIKTTGAGSIECLAWTAQHRGNRGPVSLAVDAQRGEYYLADYLLEETGIRPLQPLGIVSREEIERRLCAGSRVFGPDLSREFPAATELFPHAATLAGLVAGGATFTPAAQLEPIYLRPASFVKTPKPVRTY